jgi:hypothetical protein
LQGQPATRQARRAGRSVAGWRSSCWMSITLLTPFPGRSRYPGSLAKPYVRADCRCIGFPPVLAMAFDVSRGKSFRGARRATVLAGYDEAAPEGGRHRFEEEPPPGWRRPGRCWSMFDVSDRRAADCNQR